MNNQEKFLVKTSSYTNEVFVPNEFSRLIFRKHSFAEDRIVIDAHSDYWTFGLFNLGSCEASIVGKPSQDVAVEGPVVVFLPPFSIVEWSLKKGEINWMYYLSKCSLPEDLKQGPRVIGNVDFEEVYELMTKPLEQIIKWTLDQKDFKQIGRNLFDHIVPEKLKQKIDKNFRTKKTISDLQHDLGFSVSMSSRLFKRKFGLTPSDYRSQLRMKQASVDLLFQDQTIEKTYVSLGIEDSSYFHKCFRRYINATPSQFKLSHR